MAERTIFSESSRTTGSEPSRTIDLRRPAVQDMPPARPAKAVPEVIEWSALEHEARERGPYWFLFPGVVALALIIFGFFSKNYFFIAFVIPAFLLLGVYMKRDPRTVSYAIDGEGVKAAGTIYPFSNIKSFYVFDKNGVNELSLEVKSVLSPFLRLPLGETNPGKVRTCLIRFLPEEEHKELATDQIARSLGL